MRERAAKPRVSIGIPTYRRPALVCEAVDSALQQTYSSIEVMVSDDSPDDLTERALADLVATGRIRYTRNRPALQQARNVNRLLDWAAGELFVLLHDDDSLLPDAVAELAACFDSDPTLVVAYGKQYLVEIDGRVDMAGSLGLNEAYQRTASRAGRQASSLRAALAAQIPNDGFMVKTAAARRLGYREDPRVGHACDYDFGLRLATAYDGFFFLDRYTARYRMTGASISGENNYANLTFDLAADLDLPPELEALRSQRLRGSAVQAVTGWLERGDRRAALRVYGSTAYGWKRRLSAQGVLHAILLCSRGPFARQAIASFKRLRGRPPPR